MVLSDPWVEPQNAGDESTTIVSEYKFGMICRPDVESQANATGGKQRNLQRSAVLTKSWHLKHKIEYSSQDNKLEICINNENGKLGYQK